MASNRFIGCQCDAIDFQSASVVGIGCESEIACGKDFDLSSHQKGIIIATSAGNRIIDAPTRRDATLGIKQIRLRNRPGDAIGGNGSIDQALGTRDAVNLIHATQDLDTRELVSGDDIAFDGVSYSIAIGSDKCIR